MEAESTALGEVASVKADKRQEEGGENKKAENRVREQWRQDRTRESWQVAGLWRFIRPVRNAGCEYACTASSSVETHKHTQKYTHPRGLMQVYGALICWQVGMKAR